MATQTHSRRGKSITDLATKEKTTYKSHNEAKRASRAIQMANGGLGRGSVQVVR